MLARESFGGGRRIGDGRDGSAVAGGNGGQVGPADLSGAKNGVETETILASVSIAKAATTRRFTQPSPLGQR